MTPAIGEFREPIGATQVEVVGAQQADIHRALREGSFDLGLVNYLEGDDKPPELETTTLLRGRRSSACGPTARSPRAMTSPDDLQSEPLIVMRSGYVMHRYVHRLLAGRSRRSPTPPTAPRWAS